MKYTDFDVQIEARGEGRYRVRVLNSPGGQASNDFTLPFNSDQLDNFILRLGQGRGKVRRIESPETQAAKKFGGQLFEAVFAGPVRNTLSASLQSVRGSEEEGLRIRLRLTDVPELGNIPWEFLYDSSLNRFLGLSKESPIVRFLEVPDPLRPLAVKPPLNTLVMISSPSDYPELNVKEEWRRLSESLSGLEQAGLMRVDLLPVASLSQLQRQLRMRDYHIFHFIGHAGFDESAQDGALILQDEKGRGRVVSGQDLGIVLSDERSLRLVVLNACEGGRSGQADPFAGCAQSLLQQRIPAVIAMQFEISDDAAITFSREFYDALARSDPVDTALAEARRAIFAGENGIEWGTPVLYMRTDDGRVFDIQSFLGAPSRIEPHSLPSPVEPLPAQPLPSQPVASAAPATSAQALPPAPAPSIQASPAALPALKELYTKALAAFYSDNWQDSAALLKQIVAIDPKYKEAEQKLVEAQLKAELEALYMAAALAAKESRWHEAEDLFGQLVARAPDYRDAAGLLKEAQRQDQLTDLYQEAQMLSEAVAWRPVLKIFDQIRAIDPAYPDPDGLFERATQALVQQDRSEQLAGLYADAIAHLEHDNWAEAVRLLDEIERRQPDYEATRTLLERGRRRLAEQHDAEKWDAALAAMSAEQWGQAQGCLRELIGANPSAAHPSRGKAADLLAEAERREKQEALYASATKAMQGGQCQEAVGLFGQVVALGAGYRDAEAMLQLAQRQVQLADLKREAQRLAAARSWRAFLDVCDQVHAIDPSFKEPEGLLKKARAEVEAEDRKERLAALYAEANRQLDGEQWSEAVRQLEEVEAMQPNYQATRAMLKRGREGLAKQAQSRKLWDEALSAIAAEQWGQAEDRLRALLKLDPSATHPAQGKASDALAKVREDKEGSGAASRLGWLRRSPAQEANPPPAPAAEPIAGESIASPPSPLSAQPPAKSTGAEPNDGRAACPYCGYRNTTHRTICKNCRADLPG